MSESSQKTAVRDVFWDAFPTIRYNYEYVAAKPM